MRGIKQQFKRLKELKHLNVTFAFVCFDLTQQRQTIKRDGKGAYYDNLLNGRPIVDKRDIQRKKQRDGLTETYFPHEENLRETQFITPTKLSCGPGVSRNIAREQMETLQDVNIQPGHENDSYSHGMITVIVWRYAFDITTLNYCFLFFVIHDEFAYLFLESVTSWNCV